MSINFPDLQVLMPRAEEIARTPPLAHLQDAHQQTLAAAAQVEAERQRRRVARTRAGAETDRAGRHTSSRSGKSPKTTRPDGLGHRVDVRV